MLKRMIMQGIFALVCLVLLICSGIYCVPRVKVYMPACYKGTVIATDVYKNGFMDLEAELNGEAVRFTWDYSGNEPSWKKGDALLIYGEIDTETHGEGSNVDLIIAKRNTAYLLLGILLLSATGFIVLLILFIRNWKLGALRQFSISQARENVVIFLFGVEVIALILSAGIVAGYCVCGIGLIFTRGIETGHIVSMQSERTGEVHYDSNTHHARSVKRKTVVVKLDEPNEGEGVLIKTYRTEYNDFLSEGMSVLVTLKSDGSIGQIYTGSDLLIFIVAAVILILHKKLCKRLYPEQEGFPLLFLTDKLRAKPEKQEKVQGKD